MKEICNGCGAEVECIEYEVPPDTDVAPGCWKLFCDLLSNEYGEHAYPPITHRLTVDAYACQHPGAPSVQSIQSIAVHLISLYLIIEKGVESRTATDAIRKALGKKLEFSWLEPPENRGEMTILDVFKQKDPESINSAVKQWAQSVWDAWSSHHDTVKKWAEEVHTQ